MIQGVIISLSICRYNGYIICKIIYIKYKRYNIQSHMKYKFMNDVYVYVYTQ